jgi:hypothetical protein
MIPITCKVLPQVTHTDIKTVIPIPKMITTGKCKQCTNGGGGGDDVIVCPNIENIEIPHAVIEALGQWITTNTKPPPGESDHIKLIVRFFTILGISTKNYAYIMEKHELCGRYAAFQILSHLLDDFDWGKFWTDNDKNTISPPRDGALPMRQPSKDGAFEIHLSDVEKETLGIYAAGFTFKDGSIRFFTTHDNEEGGVYKIMYQFHNFGEPEESIRCCDDGDRLHKDYQDLVKLYMTEVLTIYNAFKVLDGTANSGGGLHAQQPKHVSRMIRNKYNIPANMKVSAICDLMCRKYTKTKLLSFARLQTSKLCKKQLIMRLIS